MVRKIECIKLRKKAEGLEFPPYPGKLGKQIFEQVSKEAWKEWLLRQTILINEYKLNPLDVEHKRYFSAQVEAYFFGDGVIIMPDKWPS